MSNDRISVIIVSCNGREDLETCLPTVLAMNDDNFEVVLVDNGSSDGSVDWVRNAFPAIRLLALPNNTGFAVGNNRGIEDAFSRGASWVALLNNDTKVDPDWLSGFRVTFSRNDRVGIVGGVILNWDGTVIEFDGSVFNPNNASGGYVDIPVGERPLPSVHQDIGYACGAALAISRDCYRATGGFDQDYFCYNEDVDLSLRAWIAGFRVMLSPHSIIRHRRGSSTKRLHKNHFSDYYGMRNALTTVLKNYELSTLRCYYRDLIRIHLLSEQQHRRLGVFMNLLFLPRTLFKRYRIQRGRKCSDRDIFIRIGNCANGGNP